LHWDDLPLGDIEEREGFRVTRPLRTLRDLVAEGGLPRDLLKQAFDEARSRGLITAKESRSANFPAWLAGGKEGGK
jgi:hypothetical protein